VTHESDLTSLEPVLQLLIQPGGRGPQRACGARPACARADLGAPWPQVGAAPRWGRAEFVSRGGPPCVISQPFAPILPAGKAPRPPRTALTAPPRRCNPCSISP